MRLKEYLGPLPLRAGRFPRNAPHLRPASARSILDPAHAATFRGASVIAASLPQAPPLIPLWQRSLMHVHPPPPPTARLASAPASSEWQTSRCPGLPWPRHRCRMQGQFLPAFPRGLAQYPSPATRGHGFGKKLRLTEVTGFTLSTGRHDTPGHLHGMMRVWKKSCANQRV